MNVLSPFICGREIGIALLRVCFFCFLLHDIIRWGYDILKWNSFGNADVGSKICVFVLFRRIMRRYKGGNFFNGKQRF